MSKRNRPTAFEVSFGEAQETKKKKQGNDGEPSSSGSASGSTRYKPRTRPPPPILYYKPPPNQKVTRETSELSLIEEEPFDDDDSDDDQSRSGSARPRTQDDKKPVRILTNFTAYDRNNKNEMVALNVVELEDLVGRDLVVVGNAKPMYDEENIEEDEGQDDDDDNSLFLQLSAVLRLDIAYTKSYDPVYVETNWAWYKLVYPSKEYEPVHAHFMFPESVAQVVITNAMNHRNETFDQFLQKFTNWRNQYLHNRTYTEQDLWDSVPEILHGLQAVGSTEGNLASTPLIQAILKNSGAFKASRPTGRIAAAVRQRPASEIRGNPDDAALKEANQNATQVTPRIAELAEGYVQEILRVVGRRPPQPNKTHFEKNQKERWNRVIEMMRQGRKKKKAMHWDKEDRIQRGSRFVKRVRVEGEIYYVGDVVVVPNHWHDFWRSKDLRDADLKTISPQAKLHDFFWFAKILWISHDTFEAHVQWFEHASGLFLQEFAHDQHLYLTHLCGEIPLGSFLGKVNVHWKVPVERWKTVGFHDFVCNSLFEHQDGSFVDPPDNAFVHEIPPPDNCPVCTLRAQRDQETKCMQTSDENGAENGFTYQGQKYHYDEFVAYYSDAGQPANIGFITGIKANAGREEDVGYVKCKRVGRIADLKDILPANVVGDERHLFMTDEEVKVKIENIIGVVFAPCEETLTKGITREEWVNFSPNHFFVNYRFRTMRPTSWNQRVRIRWKDHPICTICCNERCEEVRMAKQFVNHHRKNPLKAMDIFGGVGAFSDSVAQACGAIKVTHAIEVAPSAAHTFKHNFPDVTVYNQCTNTMLQYTLKSWEGHPNVQRPYQLYDENVPVPLPPEKGEIKVITAGFPCQSHSALNIWKKTDDIKSNLVLNALSWIDAIRPYYVFLENVPGFLSFRLNGTQVSEHRIEGGIEMGGLKLLVRAMLDMGYQVRFALLNAAHYGTPQRRVRFFLVGALSGHPLPDIPQPSHFYAGATSLEIKLPYYFRKEPIRPIRVTPGTALHKTVTIEDAISDLPPFDWKPPQRTRGAQVVPRRSQGKEIPLIECTKKKPRCGLPGTPSYHHNPETRYQMEARMMSTRDLQHFTKVLKPAVVLRVTQIRKEPLADYRSLAPRLQEWQLANPESYMGRSNYKRGPYGRLDKNDVFPTIVTNVAPTAKQGRILHYIDNRISTVREHARGQGFPDSFFFKALQGRVTTIHRQIGNAVPYPVGRALGRQLRISMMGKWVTDQQNAIQVDDSSDVEMQDADDMYASS